VNPGPLRDGRFAILSMVKVRKEDLVSREVERRVLYENARKNEFWIVGSLELFTLF